MCCDFGALFYLYLFNFNWDKGGKIIKMNKLTKELLAIYFKFYIIYSSILTYILKYFYGVRVTAIF